MRIDLLGTSFTIKTDEDDGYLHELIEYLRGKITEIESSVGTNDPIKVAILSALLAVDELFKARSESEAVPRSDHAEELAERLIRELDNALTGDPVEAEPGEERD